MSVFFSFNSNLSKLFLSLIFLLSFLFTSCNENTTTTKKKCNDECLEWQICNYDGKCVTALGNCETPEECSKEFPVCNLETHKCEKKENTEFECYDLDKDGYGAFCDKGPDCNDNNPQIHPNAIEICGDELDNNCNTVVDEYCSCTTGEIVLCYGAPEQTRGIGECRAGYRICEDGKFSDCENQVIPTEEIYDNLDNNCDGNIDEGFEINACGKLGAVPEEICGDGLDNDCNGVIDDNCPACTDKEVRGCFSGIPEHLGQGECKGGTQVCNDGIWGPCENEIKETLEICDNLDNDCDGKIDEGVKNSCGTCGDIPEEICDGIDNDCDGEVDEGVKNICGTCGDISENLVETCGDGLDNDCNGIIDDGCSCTASQECYSGDISEVGKGECKKGMQACLGGELFEDECIGEILPTIEICDGLDNNCNDIIDDGFKIGEQCFVGLGSCRVEGVMVCDTSKLGSHCEPSTEIPEPTSEKCDGIDNDCDGTIDDGFSLLGTTCGSGVGVCRGEGVYICADDELSVTCSAEEDLSKMEDTEKCGDGLDNNCNGFVDEGFEFVGTDCSVGVGACKAEGTYQCTDTLLEVFCSAGEVGEPTNEICGNNIDDNCNGFVDEGFELKGEECTAGKGVCENTGVYICDSDNLTNPLKCSVDPLDNATLERCDDELDNDCDGFINEGFEMLGVECSSGVGACKNSGTYICDPNTHMTLECSAQAGEAGDTELCGNNIDDNCNGFVDEGFELKGEECYAGKGICQSSSVYKCNDDLSLLVCDAVAQDVSVTELCGNDLDDDCDGFTDEGFDIGASCSNNQLGLCQRSGTIQCVNGGESCSAQHIDPSTEICDGEDNDCDGDTDEGFDNLYQSCNSSGYGVCKTQGVYVCDPDDASQTTCSALPLNGSAEICNDGLDNDCDNKIDYDDEDCTLPTYSCDPLPNNPVIMQRLELSGNVVGDPDSMGWEVVSEPAGSNILLRNPTSSTTSFVPLIAGDYHITFTVTIAGTPYVCDYEIFIQPSDSLNVSMSWGTPADFDLHLLKPGATNNDWGSTDDCHYDNCRICPIDVQIPGQTCVANNQLEWFTSSSSDDPQLDIDNRVGCVNGNCYPENLSIESPHEGNTEHYTIGVYYYSGKANGREGEDSGNIQDVDITVYCRDDVHNDIVEHQYRCEDMHVGTWCFVRDIIWENSICTIGSATRRISGGTTAVNR